MRVLVLGSNGMAGHVIKEHLSTYSKFELFGIEEEFFLSFIWVLAVKVTAVRSLYIEPLVAKTLSVTSGLNLPNANEA